MKIRLLIILLGGVFWGLNNSVQAQQKKEIKEPFLLTIDDRVNASDLFNKYFEDKSLRIDFDLSGNDQVQRAALTQMREEPVWAGPTHQLIDPFEYGGYMIKVYDKLGEKLLFSRGFNTLFEEWRTSAQAKQQTQSWSHSVSIPYPIDTVLVDIMAREKSTNEFNSLLKFEVDPKSIFIDRGDLKHNPITKIQYKGDITNKVDLVFVAEGYTSAEQEKFVADAKRFAEALFSFKPFDKHREDFNIWAVGVDSEESGTDFSGRNIYRNTALKSSFYTFGVERYLTIQDFTPLKDAVWEVPCDAIFVLVNSAVYGGGGMYNFYAIGTADNKRTLEVFVHEFGHSFAGLADEYYNTEVVSDEFYNKELEPWEPNITTLVDFDSKWKDMLSIQTPIPTPLTPQNSSNIGVFEGAGYVSKGIYRPMKHCMMKDLKEFCPVCQRAINRMINFWIDKPIK